jgi:MinD-like ATPase involved in chromosome partitioning or flagellar assembly
MPHVIAVASGKGGVGKTSISVNLGISLARAGQRVLILDADTGLANVNILLGQVPQYTLEHVLFGAKNIEEVMLSGPHGLKVIPGANGISECVTLHPRQQMRLTRELARIESDFDYLILDTAAGIGDNTLDFAAAAHQTLVVITPEPTSLTDAFSLVKLLHRRRQLNQFQIVINMASSATQAREVFHRFSAAVEKYIGVMPHLLGFLLLDESLRNAVSLQHPVALFPDTDPSSRSFIRLAEGVRQVFDAAGAPSTSFADYWQKQFRDNTAPPGATPSPLYASGPAAAPAAAPPRRAAVKELSHYLAELKARLLVLAEKPDVDAAQLGELIEAAHEAYVRRFHKTAVDPVALVQTLTESEQRDDQLLRALGERLQPWMPVRESPPRAAVAPADVAMAAAAAEMSASVESAAAAAKPAPRAVARPLRTHRYDDGRFGSQDTLRDLLRRQGDSGKSVLELIDVLR